MGVGWWAYRQVTRPGRGPTKAQQDAAAAQARAATEERRRQWMEQVQNHTVLGDAEVWGAVDQQEWFRKSSRYSDFEDVVVILACANLAGGLVVLHKLTGCFDSGASAALRAVCIAAAIAWAALVGVVMMHWRMQRFYLKVNRSFASSGWDVSSKLDSVQQRHDLARAREKQAAVAKRHHARSVQQRLVPAAPAQPGEAPTTPASVSRIRRERDFLLAGWVLLLPALAVAIYGIVVPALWLGGPGRDAEDPPATPATFVMPDFVGKTFDQMKLDLTDYSIAASDYRMVDVRGKVKDPLADHWPSQLTVCNTTPAAGSTVKTPADFGAKPVVTLNVAISPHKCPAK